jgi:hypothetical protein
LACATGICLARASEADHGLRKKRKNVAITVATAGQKKPQITTLRSGRDDKSIVQSKFVISTGGVMGLRPTQGDEKRLLWRPLSHGSVALAFVISTEANPDFLPRGTGQDRVCAFL